MGTFAQHTTPQDPKPGFLILTDQGRLMRLPWFLSRFVPAATAIVGLTLWKPIAGFALIFVLFAGTFIGPMIPLVNLLARDLRIVALVAGYVTAFGTTGEGQRLVVQNTGTAIAATIILAVIGFFFISGLQMLWISKRLQPALQADYQRGIR